MCVAPGSGCTPRHIRQGIAWQVMYAFSYFDIFSGMGAVPHPARLAGAEDEASSQLHTRPGYDFDATQQTRV